MNIIELKFGDRVRIKKSGATGTLAGWADTDELNAIIILDQPLKTGEIAVIEVVFYIEKL